MKEDELLLELEKVKTELALMKGKQKKEQDDKIYFKVSQKGAVSVYGLGKFPVTLYKQQWDKLLGKKEALLDFISDNQEMLAVKDKKSA